VIADDHKETDAKDHQDVGAHNDLKEKKGEADAADATVEAARGL